jgi:hypothetical protein
MDPRQSVLAQPGQIIQRQTLLTNHIASACDDAEGACGPLLTALYACLLRRRVRQR